MTESSNPLSEAGRLMRQMQLQKPKLCERCGELIEGRNCVTQKYCPPCAHAVDREWHRAYHKTKRIQRANALIELMGGVGPSRTKKKGPTDG